MIARLLVHLRSLRAFLGWLRSVRQAPRGLEELFTEPLPQRIAVQIHRPPLASECPLPDCRTCEPEPPLVIRSEAQHLGRTQSDGDNIREVCVWLRHRLHDE